MDILLQSDGQLYPPRHAERSRPPAAAPKPEPPQKPPPPPPKEREPIQALPWEDLLLIGLAFLLIRSSEKPDIPLLLALAYILFDPHFSLPKFG